MFKIKDFVMHETELILVIISVIRGSIIIVPTEI